MISTNESTLKFNRYFFPNSRISTMIYPAIYSNLPSKYTDQINQNLLPQIELVNLKITQTGTNMQTIYVKFYLVTKTLMWNDSTNLIEMKFIRYPNTNEFELIGINDDVNCVDIGALIPQMSDIPFNRFQRERDWTAQQVNWDRYKRDWDVTWSDIPYHRQINNKENK